jgi:hypothetical protein
MPPPPNPPRGDEDEIMDIVPDSEPPRMTDGPTPSLHPPELASRAPTLNEDANETVPESSGEMGDGGLAQGGIDCIAQGEKMQETDPDTEQDDDPMDSDQPLANKRKRSPKPILEAQEQQVGQEERGDAIVPESESEVPLVTLVKPPKPAPKSLPPRGRSTRNKRPIVYTESPDGSENEVSTMELWSMFTLLKRVSGRGRNPG